MQNSIIESIAPQTIAYSIGDNLYLNITDRCTLRCRFCPKYNGTHQVHQYDLRLRRKPSLAEILQAIDAAGDITQFKEVVFCGYGEPTLRLKELLAVARYVKSQGVKVRLNTDGLANRVHKHNVLPDLAQCIDAVSVSMNAQNEAVYKQHCCPSLEGSYQAMLEFLQQAPLYIGDVTATAIDGLDGVDVQQCAAIAKDLNVKFRRRVLDVVG
ncbi:MAG: radical SAM protein [Gammaproteobacteria bacterium SG8_11]|nr:MAG: radical SAM protein [Gammaproteobacteria bacterium SG8_11]